MIILGINAFHGDSSAALVRDGKLVAAAEEERFRRVKHWAGFPSQSIAYCLQEAGVRLADVNHVAVNQNDRAQRLRKIAYLAAHPPEIRRSTYRRSKKQWSCRSMASATSPAQHGVSVGRATSL
jgi:carbamoyltransferase